MMTAQERATIARDAAELVESGFCKHQLAKNAQGEPTFPEDLDAVEFCVVGAIDRAAFTLGCTEVTECFSFRAPGVISGLFDHLNETGRLNTSLSRAYSFRHSCVVTWNNDCAKDGADVAEVLRAYADKEEAAG
jgi:hypothetical protein